MISRSPNNRASSENAPGPVRTRAAVATTMRGSAEPAANKLGAGGENHESATLTLHKPAAMQEIGVNSPIRSAVPLTTANELTTHVGSDGLLWPERPMTP